jgi:hypothetical protein
MKSLGQLCLTLCLTLGLMLCLTRPAFSQVTSNSKWQLCPLMLERNTVLVNPVDIESLFLADENASKLNGNSQYCKYFEDGPRYLIVTFDKSNNKESYIRWLKANNKQYRIL